MKPGEQRIAIAKACGYKLTALAQNPSQRTWQYGGATIELPDYLNDLNAMHEAEKVLSNEQAFTMREHAWSIASFKDGKCGHASRDEQGRNCYNATATQRAEAFLRTLNLYTP